jgi:hypothetical protein
MDVVIQPSVPNLMKVPLTLRQHVNAKGVTVTEGEDHRLWRMNYPDDPGLTDTQGSCVTGLNLCRITLLSQITVVQATHEGIINASLINAPITRARQAQLQPYSNTVQMANDLCAIVTDVENTILGIEEHYYQDYLTTEPPFQGHAD